MLKAVFFKSVHCHLATTAFALVPLGCGGAPDSTSWNFVDHFASATVAVEPTLIDMGTPEVRRSLLSGWSRDERAGDMFFVWGIGEQSVLGFSAPLAT